MGRELRLVPLDFMYPIGQTQIGYINPYKGVACSACDATGLNEETIKLDRDWYTHLRTDGQEGWCHHLTQDEVQALIDHNRLWDFTRIPINKDQDEIVKEKMANGGNSWLPFDNGYIPTADEVNEWSRQGFGHDSINRMICVETRAKQLGVYGKCPYCKGEGYLYHSEELKRLHDQFEYFNPPTGAGYQLWCNTGDDGPSPVFASVDELAIWCETNATTFAYNTATKDEWVEILPNSFFANNSDFKLGFF